MKDPMQQISRIVMSSSLIAYDEGKKDEVGEVSDELMALLQERYGDRATFVVIAAMGLTLYTYARRFHKEAENA